MVCALLCYLKQPQTVQAVQVSPSLSFPYTHEAPFRHSYQLFFYPYTCLSFLPLASESEIIRVIFGSQTPGQPGQWPPVARIDVSTEIKLSKLERVSLRY